MTDDLGEGRLGGVLRDIANDGQVELGGVRAFCREQDHAPPLRAIGEVAGEAFVGAENAFPDLLIMAVGHRSPPGSTAR